MDATCKRYTEENLLIYKQNQRSAEANPNILYKLGFQYFSFYVNLRRKDKYTNNFNCLYFVMCFLYVLI